jgi:anion-transporting  ArsA/GET3 family ATPase
MDELSSLQIRQLAHLTKESGKILREKFKDKDYAVVGDSGFRFIPDYATEGTEGFTINAFSFSRKYGQNLTEEEKRFTSTLSAIRAVIENVNAQLKKSRNFGSAYRHFSSTRKILFQLTP